MSFATRRLAIASFREFSPWLREAHIVVRFWSTTHNAYRYSRVLAQRTGRL